MLGPTSYTEIEPSCSFLLAVDGKANKDDFRPNNDEKMWWGRRDAHARCADAALWQGYEQPSTDLVGDLWFLYEDSSLMYMSSSFAKAATPTERALLRCWRKAVM